MKKILILYAASNSVGHKSIAENIGFYLQAAGFEVALYDAQKVQGGALAGGGKKLYEWMLKRVPFIWNWLYNTQWFISLTLPYRTWVASFNYDHILKKIEEFKPDTIICTHTTASAVINYLKKKKLYNGGFGIAFSDFHLHRYWLYEAADFYLANIEEQKERMIELGISSNKIFVCGMLLKPKVEVSIREVRGKFGIASEKVVLIASGSQGSGIDESLIQNFIGKSNIKVIVVCGRNKELFEKLNEKFAKTNAVILGYHSPMDELYAIADIFITKPGGLSVSESLQWGLPMIISHLLPGQEQWNYKYLIEHGLAMGGVGGDIAAKALEEIETGSFKESLANNPYRQNLFNGNQKLIEAVNITLSSALTEP